MKYQKNNNRGFTLLELIIVVIILGVLSMLAIPAYQDYVARGKRVSVRNQIADLQQRLEQNYTLFRTWEIQKVDQSNGNKTAMTEDDALTKFYGSLVKQGNGGQKFVFLPEGKDHTTADFAVRFDYVKDSNNKVIGTVIRGIAINRQAKADNKCITYIQQSNGAKIASRSTYWTETTFGADNSRTPASQECWKR